MKRVILLTGFIGLFTAWTSSASERSPAAISANEASADEDANFAFGDSCQKLGDLSWNSLAQLAAAANAGQARERFCAVDYAEDCADYSIYIEEFGSLYPGRRGFCRFSAPMRLERAVPTAE